MRITWHFNQYNSFGFFRIFFSPIGKKALFRSFFKLKVTDLTFLSVGTKHFMSKSKENHSKKDFVPEPCLESAKRLTRYLQPEQDPGDSAAMFVMTFSMLGMMKANPLINWGIWFVLLSIYINRSRTRSYLTQSGISLIMVTFSTLFLYYRLTKGLVAK